MSGIWPCRHGTSWKYVSSSWLPFTPKMYLDIKVNFWYHLLIRAPLQSINDETRGTKPTRLRQTCWFYLIFRSGYPWESCEFNQIWRVYGAWRSAGCFVMPRSPLMNTIRSPLDAQYPWTGVMKSGYLPWRSVYIYIIWNLRIVQKESFKHHRFLGSRFHI